MTLISATQYKRQVKLRDFCDCIGLFIFVVRLYCKKQEEKVIPVFFRKVKINESLQHYNKPIQNTIQNSIENTFSINKRKLLLTPLYNFPNSTGSKMNAG